ncbi:hypothetical protein HZA56_02890 [Candidatus Poribacteria bacterium]|nr:hypothetical protein [Candidatus Poribacteria bacterium]
MEKREETTKGVLNRRCTPMNADLRKGEEKESRQEFTAVQNSFFLPQRAAGPRRKGRKERISEEKKIRREGMAFPRAPRVDPCQPVVNDDSFSSSFFPKSAQSAKSADSLFLFPLRFRLRLRSAVVRNFLPFCSCSSRTAHLFICIPPFLFVSSLFAFPLLRRFSSKFPSAYISVFSFFFLAKSRGLW